MWLKEILQAIGEHPVPFILLTLGVCSVAVAVTNTFTQIVANFLNIWIGFSKTTRR